MTPSQCSTMAELRAEIDRIDARLVALLAEALWRRLIDWSIAREEAKIGRE